MKAQDFIALMEYKSAFKEPKEKRRRAKVERELSVPQMLQRELEKSEAITKWLKDYEKANKKEDKKPEGWNTPQIAMLLMFITFPPYLALFLMWRH